MSDAKQILENAAEKALNAKPGPPQKRLDIEPSPVLPLTPNMLPPQFQRFVTDVARRACCPSDFVAVALLSVFAGVVGRRFAIAPKLNDSWLVFPTLWGMMIGDPSSGKSPALDAVKRLLDIVEKEVIASAADDPEADTKPKPRIVVNDPTVPKLVDIMADNPAGLLLVRDELYGLIANLERQDAQADRAFYLECAYGNGSYTKDRVSTGSTRVEHCALSIIGGIQPSRLRPLVEATSSGVKDDGFIQRYQLAVFPDPVEWEWVDEDPDQEAQDHVEMLFRAFAASPFDSDSMPKELRFTEEAHELYKQWMIRLQGQARAPDTPAILASYMLKMPRTIPALALLFALSDGQPEALTAVSLAPLEMALRWYPYLLSHQKRILQIGEHQLIDNARLILDRRERLGKGFTARDISQRKWTGLTKRTNIDAALEILLDYGYLIPMLSSPSSGAGRPTTRYRWATGLLTSQEDENDSEE